MIASIAQQTWDIANVDPTANIGWLVVADRARRSRASRKSLFRDCHDVRDGVESCAVSNVKRRDQRGRILAALSVLFAAWACHGPLVGPPLLGSGGDAPAIGGRSAGGSAGLGRADSGTGTSGSGGVAGTGGTIGAGGTTTGGTTTGGSGGTTGTGGGTRGTGGTTTGGSGGTGGAGATAGSVDCSGTMPSSGTEHTSNNASGNAGGLNWTIWTNSGPGTITTYDVPAFSASWGLSGDFLARIGLEWGNSGKTYKQFGTITAQFAETRTGTAGSYSYVGVYGWSYSPCVEYYIIDDSFNTMPVNLGSAANKGTVDVDGGTYTMYTRSTSGTGGSRCTGVSNWLQFYSIRHTARQCGTISITQHFDAWAAAGMTLGNMIEAKVLIETAGGTGSIRFPTANVAAR